MIRQQGCFTRQEISGAAIEFLKKIAEFTQEKNTACNGGHRAVFTVEHAVNNGGLPVVFLLYGHKYDPILTGQHLKRAITVYLFHLYFSSCLLIL